MDKSGIGAGPHSGILDENGILAAFISELPEGVLVCDAEGRISLFIRRAAEFLTGEEGRPDAAGRAIGLGRPVFEAMDRHAVEHALDEIGDKLRRNALNAIAYFTVRGHGGRTLQVRAIPILERPGRFAGFILILHDITDRLEIDRRVETLFRSLTRSSKSPLVDIVRIYALRHGVRETNTHDRLYGLYLKNIISRKDQAELEQAYSFLMQLRFLRQIAAVETESAEPDNAVPVKSLSRIERNILKEAFKRIETLQTRASFDFIGMSDAHMK